MSSLYGASAQSTAAPQGAPAGSVSIPFPALHGKSPASNRRFIAAAPGAGNLRPHTQLVRRVPAGAQFCCKRGVHSTIAINVADKIRKPHITIGAVKFAGAVAEYDAALIEAAFFPASTVDISDGNAKTGNESMAPRDFICAQARMVHIAAPQAAESTDCKILLYALQHARQDGPSGTDTQAETTVWQGGRTILNTARRPPFKKWGNGMPVPPSIGQIGYLLLSGCHSSRTASEAVVNIVGHNPRLQNTLCAESHSVIRQDEPGCM